MSNQIQNPKKIYNLKERTLKFGIDIINFVKKLPDDLVNRPLIAQIIRSATSIGANYMEADGAISKKDFQHKIGISKKESKETMYWLKIIDGANPIIKDDCEKLWREAHELTLIFSSILLK